jgi:hypothetical protein
MARQGYDDTPHIQAVEALLAAEPGLTRRQAIRRVVGENPSNVRRIESKMTALARHADQGVAQGHAASPVPDADATAKASPQGVVPARHAGEFRFVATGILMTLGGMAAWTLAPNVLIYPYFGLAWVELHLAHLLGMPGSGREALDFVSALLSSGRAPTTVEFADVLRTKAATGTAFHALCLVGTGLCAVLCTAVALVEALSTDEASDASMRDRARSTWLPLLGLFALTMAVVAAPAISDVAIAVAALLSWQVLRNASLPAPVASFLAWPKPR